MDGPFPLSVRKRLKELCRLVFKCDFKKQLALLRRIYTVSFVKNGAMKSWNNEYSLCTALQQTNSLQRLEMILLLFQTQQVHLKSFSTEIQNTILLFYLKTVIWNAKMFQPNLCTYSSNIFLLYMGLILFNLGKKKCQFHPKMSHSSKNDKFIHK